VKVKVYARVAPAVELVTDRVALDQRRAKVSRRRPMIVMSAAESEM